LNKCKQSINFVPKLKDTPSNVILDMIQEEKKRYSEEDLKEFEELISQKLDATRSELNYIKETLSKRNDSGTDNTSGNSKLLEDGADTSERENLSQLAARLQKFIQQLDAAMVRIKNGTYGVCKDTGKLIPKERLRAVPHTQQTIEAKLRQSK
jgi:DnaK suppressor protein